MVSKLGNKDKVFKRIPDNYSAKTDNFLAVHGLTMDDLQKVFKSLTYEDVYKINYAEDCPNTWAISFIKDTPIKFTDKKSNEKTIGPFHLYIKLDYSSIRDKCVLVISIHDVKKDPIYNIKRLNK